MLVGLNFVGIVLQLGSSGTSLAIDLIVKWRAALRCNKVPLTNLLRGKFGVCSKKGSNIKRSLILDK
ncbi:hypothetical protein BH18THE2_BH18THE2_10690 [soil metagenome]